MDDRAPGPRVDHTAERRLARERLLDLAQDASSYLRRHRQTAVRASAALLVAASLAACSPSADDDDDGVEPLEEEVQSGLPSQAGRYPVRPDSVARDPQGVYYFKTLQSGATTWTQANTSLLRLASGSSSELEVSPGADPTLYLPPEVPVAMVADATEAEQLGALAATPTPSGTGSSGSSYSHTRWYPFYAGSIGSVPNTTPAYRNPPPQDISATNTVSGSDSRTTAPPPAERVVGISHGVSGQAGGTGRGSAATLKSGAAAAGKSGGSGSGTAASGKSSSGGLFGARSGGFSTGKGGSSGSSSS
jgi:hypothetical protein